MPRLSCTRLAVAGQGRGTTTLTTRLTFSTATTAWLTAVEAADDDADSLGPMNDGVWNAKGTLADAFALLCPTGTLVFGDGARSLAGALIQAQGTAPVGVNLEDEDWDGRSFGLSPTGSKNLNTTVDNTSLLQDDRHIAVVSAGGSGVHSGFAYLIGGNFVNGGIHFTRTNGFTISTRMSSNILSSLSTVNNPFLFPAGTYGLFRNTATDVTVMVENDVTVFPADSQAPVSQNIRIGAAQSGTSGLDVRVSGYTLGCYVDPIVLRDLLNTATASITAAINAIAAALA